MNKTEEIIHPYKGQKFTSFEHLKKYLEEYGQKNYVKFWIRSSHTRQSQKSKISKTMNPDLKYVSIKFACIFGGEKIRRRGSGIRKSSTYRNLGCPFMINAVVGEDGNHVKLDTVILEHNHTICKTLYESLKKRKRRGQTIKNNVKLISDTKSVNVESEKAEHLLEAENLENRNEWLEVGDNIVSDLKNKITLESLESDEKCLKDFEDKYGKNIKILVINSENQNNQIKKESGCNPISALFKKGVVETESPEICRLCLSSKDKLSPIFNPNLPLESTVLSLKIMGCASIEVNSNDGLPNNICTTCEENLHVAYNFRITCEKSDSILRETYAKSISITNTTECEKYLEGENEGETLQETMIVYTEEENEEIIEQSKQAQVSAEEQLYFQFAISCPVCATDFETFESLLEHLGTHTDEEAFLLACNICTLVCSSVKDLREHMGEHLNETRSETWACGTCYASFPTAEDLKTHEETHEESHEEAESLTKKQINEVVKYLCNVCGKIFKTKDRFQSHRNMHEGLRPHVCLQCGRGFADRKNLHQHYDVVHLRKVRHECPVCQRKFYTRTKMKSHMTMHSGDKPFTCDICSKTFRLKMNMNKHKKTHSKDRPYQCDKCSAAFIERNLLKRHSYKHGGVRPFRCLVCGHGFSAKFCLKKHLKDSKCRGVIVPDQESYQWLGMNESEQNLDDGKCIIVYKTEVEDALAEEETAAIDLDILHQFKDESNT